MTDNAAQFDPMARRTLAAIVFTDIANASRLMGENEEHALKLVARDLELVGGLCRKHSGRVLKTTGDGLLMYFSSAVQAVACALEVQAVMGEQAKNVPAADVLMHRIGIHLGDVFVSETDVMGDGVNIAARLQSEAEPGGICISETVYDVVKNRLALKATYLGPRELKNIKDAVPVYQILVDAAATGGKPRPAAAKPRTAMHHMKPWLIAAVGLLLVLCAATAYQVFFRGGQDPGGGARGGAVANVAVTNDPDQKRISEAKFTYLPRYDFAGMVKWLEKNGLKDHSAHERYVKLRELKNVVHATLLRSTAASPITIEVPSSQGPGGNLQLWAGQGGTLTIKEAPSGERQSRLEELSPAMFQSVVAAVLRSYPSVSPRLREAQQILAEELGGVK